jgi:hypothetical protein
MIVFLGRVNVCWLRKLGSGSDHLAIVRFRKRGTDDEIGAIFSVPLFATAILLPK